MERPQNVSVVVSLCRHELVAAQDRLSVGAQRDIALLPAVLADDGEPKERRLKLGADDPGVLDAVTDRERAETR
ncbi:MAG: hypothetical protein ACOVOA_18705, partial [Allorhizobium sp.]